LTPKRKESLALMGWLLAAFLLLWLLASGGWLGECRQKGNIMRTKDERLVAAFG